MPRVQIEIHDPPTDWLVALSESHPDDEFRILAAYPGDGETIGILEARTHCPASVLEALDEADGLSSFREMDADGEVLLIEYRMPKPEMQRLTSETGTVPRYPVIFRNGRIIATQTTSRDQLSKLTDAYDSAGVGYNIRFLVRSLTSNDLLTARQREFIERAIAAGYYESPRRCSLTELATEMDVHKTTAGDVLHRAEGKIIAEFVTTHP